MVESVVMHGLATLKELTEWYSLKELYQMEEMIRVKNFNEHRINSIRRQRRKLSKR